MTLSLFICHFLVAADVARGVSSLDMDAEVKKIRDNRVACGPLCCWYCLARFGTSVPAEVVIERARLDADGMSVARLVELCKSFGLDARAVVGPRDRFSDLPIPAILFLDDQHSVVYDGRGENRTYESARVFEPVTRHAGDDDALRLRDLWTGEAIVFADVGPSPIRLYVVSLSVAAVTILAASVFRRIAGGARGRPYRPSFCPERPGGPPDHESSQRA